MPGRAAWTERKHLGVVLTTQEEITGKIRLQVFYKQRDKEAGSSRGRPERVRTCPEEGQ